MLKGRHDLDNYNTASRTCRNFIPTRYGQLEKRSGTQHLGFAKHDDKIAVLHEFQFSVTTKFFLEFGDLYIRFWSNDLQVDTTPSAWVTTTAYVIGDTTTESGTTYYCSVAHTSGTFATDLAASKWYALEDNILEVVTPYLEAELYEIQLRRVNDVVYLAHPNHPTGKLTRLADDNWTYEAVDFTMPYVNPDVDNTEVILTPSANTGSITVTGSAKAFEADHVGSGLRLRFLRPAITKMMIGWWALRHSTYYPGSSNPASFNPATVYAVGDKVDTYSSSIHHFSTCTAAYDATTTWASAGTTYAVGDLAEHNPTDMAGGDLYWVCIQAHTTTGTGATDEPGDGATWEDYWTQITTAAHAPTYFDDGVVAMQAVEVIGEWSFMTSGTWTGTWVVERSIDGGTTWSTAAIVVSAGDNNENVTDDETEEVLIRVSLRELHGSHFSKKVFFNVESGNEFGIVDVTAVAGDGLSCTATVDGTLPQISNTLGWQETGFSPRQGYPRTVAMLDNRLLLCGTSKKPLAYFYSGISDYENFLGGTLADSPFYIEIFSEDQSAVQWISAQRELFTGTASVEGVLLARKTDEAQSAENLPVVRWHESMGSAHRPALAVRDSLMVLQRGRTTLNMLSYSLDKDGYAGEEVSLLCRHLFTSGVQQMANVREPYTGAYAVTEAGTVCHMVYEPKLQVTGWCEFTTKGGTFESLQTLSGSGDEDDRWCVVKRTINSTTRRHIEKFVSGNTQRLEDRDADNMWYVDAGVKVTGSGLTTITGLTHLEGEEVECLIDGNRETLTVASGIVTPSKAFSTGIAGLCITSEFEPLDLESQGTFGKRKQLHQTKLMVWRSMGGEVASDGKDFQAIEYHTAGEAMDTAIPLADGFKEIFHESSHGRNKFFRIKHADPYPFTLQAVVQEFKPTSR